MTPEFMLLGEARDRCRMQRELDKTYHTSTRSPLHHDNNCPIHADPNVILVQPLSEEELKLARQTF